MKTFIYALMLAVAVLAAPPLATTARAAVDVVGTILEVEGIASISSPGGKAATARVKTPVHPGDVLSTGPRSRIYVQLIDNTELTLGENGQMTVDDYAYDTHNNKYNRATYSVLKGAFLYVSGLLAKKENPDVQINIPYGTVGIRGTRFWGGMVDGDYGVIVGEGAVVVDTGGGNVSLTRGQATTLRAKGTPPTPAQNWDKGKIERATATVALKNPAAVGQRMYDNQDNNMILRDRHRIILKERIKKIIEEEKAKPPVPDDDDASKPGRRLQDLKRERQKRGLSANNTVEQLGDTVSKTTSGVTSGLTSSGVVRATPLRETVTGTTSTVTKSVTDTASGVTQTTTATTRAVTDTAMGAVDKTVQTTTKVLDTATGGATAPVSGAVGTVTTTTTEAVSKTVDTTTKAVDTTVKGTTNVLKNTTGKLLGK